MPLKKELFSVIPKLKTETGLKIIKMKTLLLIIITFLLTYNGYCQDYLLKIYNSRTNKKTYYREVGDKVKIESTNSKGKERFVKSKIYSISRDSISFNPRSENYKAVVINIRNLDYIEIRTPGMIISSYSLTIFGILTMAFTRSIPLYWTAYRKIDFKNGKWAKEIVQTNSKQ